MKNTIKSFILLAFFCWLPSTVCIAEVTYYHTDAMGTPMAMTDSTGKVVWQGDFYPFGEEYEVKETPNKNKRRFTGKEKDEESGLHYFGARYMDEASGRFVSPDPVTAVDAQTSKTNTALLGNPLRLNRYVYGLNNPHRYIDPDGNLPVFLVPALIGAAISYLSAPDVANAPKSSSSQTFQSHGERSIAAGAVGGAGLRGVGSVLALKKATTGGMKKAEKLSEKQHNVKLSGGRRMDLKGRHRNSTGHYNKQTKTQYGYPHVHDKKSPGGVRNPTPKDYRDIKKP